MDRDEYPDMRDSPYWDDECEEQFQKELQEPREEIRESNNFLGVDFEYVPGDPFW